MSGLLWVILAALGGGSVVLVVSWWRLRRKRRWDEQVQRGVRALQAGDIRGATEILEAALAEAERRWAPTDAPIVAVYNPLAQCYDAAQLWERAWAMCEREFAWVQRHLGDDHPRTVNILNDLALLAHNAKQPQRAEEYARQALTQGQSLYEPRHLEIATSEKILGELLVERGAWEEARSLWVHAMESFRRALGPECDAVVHLRRRLLEQTLAHSDHERATVYQQQELAFLRKHRGADDPQTIQAAETLLCLFQQQERWEEAALLETSLQDLPPQRP